MKKYRIFLGTLIVSLAVCIGVAHATGYITAVVNTATDVTADSITVRVKNDASAGDYINVFIYYTDPSGTKKRWPAYESGALHQSFYRFNSQQAYTIKITGLKPSTTYQISVQGEYADYGKQDLTVTTKAAGATTATVDPSLPVCIQKLTTLKKTDDPNAYQATVSGYGTVQFWISSKRAMLIDKNNAMATWACVGDGLSLTLDAPTAGATTGGGASTTTTTTTTQNTANQATTTGATTSTAGSGGTTKTLASNNGAQGGGFLLDVKLQNPLKVDTIGKAITFFMNTIMKIAIPFIVLFFIWAGFKFVTARGKPDKITEAKKMLWFTIIGTLLILGAWTITNAIIGTVNTLIN